MLIVGCFLASLVKELGRHPVLTGGGAWYPQSTGLLKIQHHIHSSYQKGFKVKRTGNVYDTLPLTWLN